VFYVERKNICHSAAVLSEDYGFICFGYEDGYLSIWSIDSKTEKCWFKSDNVKILNVFSRNDQKSVLSFPKIKVWVFGIFIT
jgi:hypothetical protein